jgi:hypothetical protein
VASATEPEICAFATAWPHIGAQHAVSKTTAKSHPAILVATISPPLDSIINTPIEKNSAKDL